MPKMPRQKLKILYVLEFLQKYSDEQNPVTAAEICEYLESKAISAERKSIYGDIEELCNFGYDIIRCYTPKKGFFLASREFEEAEIYLLSDAVRTARFITSKKTRELVGKLDNMLSIPMQKSREKKIYFDAALKCDNQEIFYNIDKLAAAISGGFKVSFKYTVKQLEQRSFEQKTKIMCVSPYALTWQDDHYYLVGNYEKYDNLLHLRLDRISGVEILDEKSRHFSEVSRYKEYFDIADYTNRLFGMHGGELETVELCCKRKIANQVADRFGDDIFITNVTDEEFTFSYKAAISEALVTFILNFGDNVKVKAPEKLENMVKERVEKVLNLYKKK